MKHGSHIMLQRFVRSTVSTAPRPYLIVEVPWLCNFSSLCSMICALISPTFSLISVETSRSPLMIASRASITQFGQSESVWRGKPSVGFDFCHDLRIGLSDHFGMKD